MHGYRPGEVTPTTALLTSHKHPADRETFSSLVEQMRSARTSFSSRHRIIDTRGRTRNVIVIGRTFREGGAVIGTEGFYLDVGEVVDDSIRGTVADHVQHFRENGAVIEQTKGMLMVVYGIPEDRAFDVLRWLSQTRNIPVHVISRAIAASASIGSWVSESTRREFDLVVLGGAEVDAGRRSRPHADQ